MGQSRVHTNELSPRDPACCDYRHLGNQLHRISVCGRCGSFVERSGRTMAATPASSRCCAGHLRSACFWQMATFYTRAGDWFAWLCVAVFLILQAFELLGGVKEARA